MKNVRPGGLFFIVTEACCSEFGFRIFAYAPGLVTPVTYITTRWLAVVVVNDSRTSCPTAVGPRSEARRAGKEGRFRSAALFSSRVSLPAFAPLCCTKAV